MALALLASLGASAQITVEVMLDQQQFLPAESLPVAVRITNRSGQPMHLGADTNWLTFSVTATDNNYIVSRIADPLVLGEFDLGSSQMATKRLDLAPYFKLERQGSYRIVATLNIKDWGKAVPSLPQTFDVIDGAKLWSQAFGLPAPGGGAPEVRKYTLEQANYLKEQLRMYVMVSDAAETHVFKVRAIGPMVSFSRPEAQLDPLSRLHVLYQSGAHVYTYTLVSPDGDFVMQENYDYVNTRPRLQTDDKGNISVYGGVHRVKPTFDDLPELMPSGQTSVPVPTNSQAPVTPSIHPSK
jgi:hypothetical protein